MPRFAPTHPCLPLLALAACGPAASGSAPVPRQTSTVRIETAAGASEVRLEPTPARGRSAVVALAPARAWAALPAAYAALGLPTGTGDEAAGRRMVGPLRLTRALGGVRLSRYLDCGATVSVANADTYAVTLQLDTRLEPAGGGGTAVETRLQASARPMDTGGGAVSCTSTGELERSLAEALRRTGS